VEFQMCGVDKHKAEINPEKAILSFDDSTHLHGTTTPAPPRAPAVCPNRRFCAVLFIGERVPSYDPREPSVAKSNYKSYLYYE
jgi:hypothetical protein